MIRSWIVWLGCAGILMGCEQEPAGLPELSPEADAVAATQPAPGPVVPARVDPGTISIDEGTYLLPPAVLVIEPAAEGLRAQLTGSDDPADQTGNTLLLDMQSGATSVSELREHPWIFRTTEDGWTDTPQGLNIEEAGWVLRPYAVTVEFVPQGESGDVMTIRLGGVFVLFDLKAPPDAPGRQVAVSGQFPAGVMVRPVEK